MKYLVLILLIISVVAVRGQNDDSLYLSTAEGERLFDLSFTEMERDSMQRGLERNLEGYRQLHEQSWPNDLPPVLIFDPRPPGYELPTEQNELSFDLPQTLLPSSEWEIAYLSVAELSTLIRDQKITSVDLTKIYLERLRRFSDTLMCTNTLLEEEALKQAERLDAELEEGKYRGPLHGIPYGIKDLFALPDHPTTWGAKPYKDQVIDEKATIIEKLEEAGAVLVAKLTSGALAMGDVWYGGKTKNPWNLEQGSSGSSAGPGSATSAGLVPFAIGTETLGSIVSPSRRNGITGLRPTFGRVSRTGGMALTWSMDKAGPMCRTANDCAIVLDAIRGADGIDQAAVDASYNYDASGDVTKLRVAYFKELFEEDYETRSQDSLTLTIFRSLGIQLKQVGFPKDHPYAGMRIILAAEAAAAFDELTRSNMDDVLVRQHAGAWPNYFRTARFIPAVEYIQANRARYALIQDFAKIFEEYDAILTPTYGGNQLLATNLTGHPSITFPNGYNEDGTPTSFTIIGGLFDEGTILTLAHAYQKVTSYVEEHPEMFKQ